MSHSYDELYLGEAQTNLARMLDFAVHDLHFDITEFFDLFIASNIARSFGSGNPSVIAGRSGIELAYDVLERCGIPEEWITPNYRFDRSEEYWTGWVLAYYQWESGRSFSEIIRYVPITAIQAMYQPYHEMDISHFVDHMNSRIDTQMADESNLKRLRRIANITQRELAKASGVPLRTIQQYEQRQKNINKAQAEYLMMLASPLACDPKDLLEK